MNALTDECNYGNPDFNTLVATGGGSTEPPHEVPGTDSTYTPEDGEDDGGVESWVEFKRNRGSREQNPSEVQDEGEALLQGQGFVVFHDVVQTLARHATS